MSLTENPDFDLPVPPDLGLGLIAGPCEYDLVGGEVLDRRGYAVCEVYDDAVGEHLARVLNEWPNVVNALEFLVKDGGEPTEWSATGATLKRLGIVAE